MSNGNKFVSQKAIIWFLITCICLLVEYLIIDFAYKFGTNENLVSYVSFAGTITSIILALLAIIYAFYQTYSQSLSGSEIKSQINNLRGVVQNIDASEDSFKEELNRIENISTKLDESIEILSESKSEVVKIHEKVTSLESNQSLGNEDSQGAYSDKIYSYFSDLVNNSAHLAKLINLAMLKVDGKRVLPQHSDEKILYGEMLDIMLFQKLSEEQENKLKKLDNYFFGIFEIYKHFKLFNVNDGIVRLQEDFKKEIRDFAIEKNFESSSLEEIYTEFWNK